MGQAHELSQTKGVGLYAMELFVGMVVFGRDRQGERFHAQVQVGNLFGMFLFIGEAGEVEAGSAGRANR